MTWRRLALPEREHSCNVLIAHINTYHGSSRRNIASPVIPLHGATSTKYKGFIAMKNQMVSTKDGKDASLVGGHRRHTYDLHYCILPRTVSGWARAANQWERHFGDAT